MGLPPALMQALFIYNMLKMSVPYTLHRYWLYPLIFILMAIPCLFLLMLVSSTLADNASRVVVHRADRHHLASPEPDNQGAASFVDVPKNFETLCLANVTMTSFMMMALFLMLAWIVYQAERAWIVYVEPTLLAVLVLEKSLWDEAEDLRGVVPPEVLPS